ncbi:hypothetical protein AOXY_G25696 [Acipenser oxyrinchus oxyrinchus]|uniref:Ig-like domain-containing protein n=1 Tax=Acipenser oxyrinchus oxyrinchus TaxID=40147 RepID=A0AAD8FYN1_ACIOX|nr:hypothetical protein AOXY_G25696 [Acipenser oxyrinchus oxyrinchus]
MACNILFIVTIVPWIGCIAADVVTQSPDNLNVTEGKTIELGCRYSATSNSPDFFWYIQYPNDSPSPHHEHRVWILIPPDKHTGLFTLCEISGSSISDSTITDCE